MNCDCTESCVMADQFTPATREIMVFTKSAKRYFDLDAVREPFKPHRRLEPGAPKEKRGAKWDEANSHRISTDYTDADFYGITTAGAPPLDWWKIDPDIPYTPQHEGEQMPATFYVGDAIEVMGKLPENSVDLILTSPPFLALRSYLPADHPDKGKEGGSQSTPGEFIDWLLDVAEACNRVLAPHGSLCIELGDTYAGSGGGGGDYDPGGWREGQEAFEGSGKRYIDSKYERVQYGDKGPPIANLHGKKQGGGSGWPLAKSLSLIPESFRFAMVYGFNPHTGRQTEPWRLRNVIRWVRPNPPVGALGDKFRPATSELMVFCKSAKRYFDLDAVREPGNSFDRPTTRQTGGVKQANDPLRQSPGGFLGNPEVTLKHHPAGAPPLDWWNIPLLEGEEETPYGPKPEPRNHDKPGRLLGKKAEGRGNWATFPPMTENPLGAPPLDWWEIPPGGYEGAHYAVFPPELCVKPVKAMCPEKVCRTCGEPSHRLTDVSYVKTQETNNVTARGVTVGVNAAGADPSWSHGRANKIVETLGFSDCGHDDWRPGLILDPFAGSGTTLAVATGHGRDAIGIDLDSRNFDLALERVGPFILTRGILEEL